MSCTNCSLFLSVTIINYCIFFITIFFIIIFFIVIVLTHLNQHGPHSTYGLLRSSFNRFKAKFCKSCCRQEKFDWRWYISIFLIIVYFLYLTVTRRALEIFTCNPTVPDDGFMWSTFSSPECPYGLCRCYQADRYV